MWLVSVEGNKERAVCGEVERMWKETVGTHFEVDTCEIRRSAWLRPNFIQVISAAIVAGLPVFLAKVARVMRTWTRRIVGGRTQGVRLVRGVCLRGGGLKLVTCTILQFCLLFPLFSRIIVIQPCLYGSDPTGRH